MSKVTVAFITAREHPQFDWFLDSLFRQVKPEDVTVLIIDAFGHKLGPAHMVYEPKPNLWQGKHRITKQDWWAASNARNTAICLCRTEWIAFLDDRCVLLDGWWQAIERAMKENYAVCGAYEKRHSLTVENGMIKNAGIVTGTDCREKHGYSDAPGEWWFGCCGALPLEWALAINGFDEICDGLSMEDIIFGMMLKNNGYAIKYDPSMKIIEDRTPAMSGPVMRREDKGISPNDKSHALLALLRERKTAQHQWDLRKVRSSILSGHPFPIPTGPTTDWYDGTSIADFA